MEILVGIPSNRLTYKALSYVWDPHFVVDMHCQNLLNRP